MREVASSSPKHVPPGEAQAACAIEVGFKPSNLPEIDSIIHHRRKPVSVSVPVEGCFYCPSFFCIFSISWWIFHDTPTGAYDDIYGSCRVSSSARRRFMMKTRENPKGK